MYSVKPKHYIRAFIFILALDISRAE